jgi:hypothetical protein
MKFRLICAAKVVVLLGCVMLVPGVVAAQDAGISGVVSDDTGGVLPGVTVTAISPALIEGQRVAISNGEGRFAFVQLAPGTYSVSFGLPGFSTVVREAVELTSGFTANIDAAMVVGGVEETITVTGATPVVDIQNVRKQTLVTAELLSTLPMSTKHVNNLVTLTPGFTGLADVGGKYSSQVGGAYHGKSGAKVSFDGMGIENTSGNSSYQVNAAAVSEMVLQTSGIGADTNADGPVINIVPKEGGNQFSVFVAGLYANSSLEGDNLTDSLKSRGLSKSNKTIKMWDESLSVGGPILRDKLWFFSAARSWGFSREIGGVYWNQNTAPGAPATGLSKFLTPAGAERKVVRFTPWVDRPIDRFSGRMEWYDSYMTRLTLQASSRDKFSFTIDEQKACNCGSSVAGRMQEYSPGYRFDPNRLMQATWTSTVTSRLLLEAGYTAALSQWNQYFMPGVTPDMVRIQDQGTGNNYGSASVYRGDANNTDRFSARASVSYVTGSHSFKAGFLKEKLARDNFFFRPGNAYFRFRNGVPNRITQYATPGLELNRVDELGIYVQDQWTVNKMTLNLGVRYDHMNGSVPAQSFPGVPVAGQWAGMDFTNTWLPPVSFAARSDVPSWSDLSPRLGMAYDVFGNGETALKVSLGRYVGKSSTNMTAANNPINTSILSSNRSWSDTNGDYVPDCDLGNFTKNGECGAMDNSFFGKQNPNAVQWNPAIMTGWNNRDYNWDFSTELQQQLRDGLSMSVGFYHNTGGYFSSGSGYGALGTSKRRLTDNVSVTQADFDPFCITAPTDSRLPEGGGYEVCGLYDVNPTKFGQVDTLITAVSDFGDLKLSHDFIQVSLDGRMANGITLGGGIDTGRSIQDNCFVVDSPQQLLNCKIVKPFGGQTQIKLFGSLPLPFDIQASGTYQDLSGPSISANYAVPNAQIVGSLGRNLSGGKKTATVPLVAPQTLFEERTRRLDLRLSKILSAGKYRIQMNFDAYNALNSGAVQSVNGTYGSAWQRPNGIIDPRIVQFGGEISF